METILAELGDRRHEPNHLWVVHVCFDAVSIPWHFVGFRYLAASQIGRNDNPAFSGAKYFTRLLLRCSLLKTADNFHNFFTNAQN